MPSTHANPPSAKLLIAHAEAEYATLTAPQITPAQAALDEAEQRVTAADADAEDARKAVNRLRARLRKAKKAVEDGTGSPSEVAAKQKDLDDAKQAHIDAKSRQVEAREDLAAAKFGMRDDMATAAERDAYYASLTDDEVDTITRALNRRAAPAAEQALTEGGQPALASTPRDTTVYTAGTIAMKPDPVSPTSRDASSTAAPPSTGAATRTSSSCSAAATPTIRLPRRTGRTTHWPRPTASPS